MAGSTIWPNRPSNYPRKNTRFPRIRTFGDHHFGNAPSRKLCFRLELRQFKPRRKQPRREYSSNRGLRAICSAERFCSRAPKPLVDSAEVRPSLKIRFGGLFILLRFLRLRFFAFSTVSRRPLFPPCLTGWQCRKRASESSGRARPSS